MPWLFCPAFIVAIHLTELQRDFVIKTAELVVQEAPQKYQRTLFIMSIPYLLYLRTSELVSKPL